MAKKIVMTLLFIWVMGGSIFGLNNYYSLKKQCIESEGFIKGWLYCSAESKYSYGFEIAKGALWPYLLVSDRSSEKEEKITREELGSSRVFAIYVCWVASTKLEKKDDSGVLSTAIKFMRSRDKNLNKEHVRYFDLAGKELIDIEAKGSLQSFYNSSCSTFIRNLRVVTSALVIELPEEEKEEYTELASEVSEVHQDATRNPEYRYYDGVTALVEAVKKANHKEISNLVSYPLRREYPIPQVRSKHEFIKRFDEIFDDKIISMIVNSNIEKDWSAVGWRGVMLNQGELWLDYEGKITAINYQSENEIYIKKQLIENQRQSLHQSLISYVKPILEWETSRYHIRIDELDNNEYRYASWAIGNNRNKKPDLILFNGKKEFQGSGGNHSYIFSNGQYLYKCDVNILGKTDTPGYLEVYKNGELIVSNIVIRNMGL
ncbi:MAG: hypothetical protein KUG76_08160 [Gammaproteobacteria bacterium]|nr:hypothetical protein [Gammaproteobacteria bacterium]